MSPLGIRVMHPQYRFGAVTRLKVGELIEQMLRDSRRSRTQSVRWASRTTPTPAADFATSRLVPMELVGKKGTYWFCFGGSRNWPFGTANTSPHGKNSIRGLKSML